MLLGLPVIPIETLGERHLVLKLAPTGENRWMIKFFKHQVGLIFPDATSNQDTRS